MANVKVFANKETDAQTNPRAKDYIPPIYRCGGIESNQGLHLNNKFENIVLFLFYFFVKFCPLTFC